MTDKQRNQIRQMLDAGCSLQNLARKLTELQAGQQYLVIEGDRLTKCTVLAGNITIPDGVAAIDGGAFRGCVRVTGVTVPESVTEIRQSAFDVVQKSRHLFVQHQMRQGSHKVTPRC